MSYILALLGLAAVALYAWQDGVRRCQDGSRYTSGARQPTPFNRRFCGWPPRLLMLVTWASFVGLAVSLGSWPAALLFLTLPGVWFCVTHPTTVDAPAMLCAWGSSLAWAHGQPVLALCFAALGGAVHERAPVFAALYAWHPLPLVGLLVPALLSLRKPAAPNHASLELADRLVGYTTIGAAFAHKRHVDLLNDTGLVWSLRGLVPLAAWLGVEPRAWVALAVAFGSRLVGTDTARSLMWAAPPLCAGVAHAPHWALALHVLTFRRAAR